jgi:hypothetical protein
VIGSYRYYRFKSLRLCQVEHFMKSRTEK